MKKIFFFLSAACAIVLFSASAAAQSDALYARTTKVKVPSSATAAPAKEPATVAVNARILRTFNQSFGSNPARWTAQGREFVARFTHNGRPAHALFANNGFMYYSVIMGAEKDLPRAVRHLIKSQYVDFAITHVTEVRAKGRAAWIANLQDARRLITVRVVDGILEETASYALSTPPKN